MKMAMMGVLPTAAMSCALDMGMRHTQTIAAFFDVGSTCSLVGKSNEIECEYHMLRLKDM